MSLRVAFSIFIISSTAVTCMPSRVQAESTAKASTRIRFVPPRISNLGRPAGRQRGGANRGGCPSLEKPLTAIVPATLMGEKKSGLDPALTTWQSVGGLTSVAHPSFVFYIPKEISASPKEFVLQDSSGQNIYMSSFPKVASIQPGFTQIRIPSKLSLETNKIYRWFFVVNCDTDAPYEVDGWIQRVVLNPVLERQLQKGNRLQQAQVFAANGIWYDALNNLVKMRRANPQDQELLSNWVELLDSVGLEDFALQPISQCCQVQENANRLKPVTQ